jgi:hypothetical protein
MDVAVWAAIRAPRGRSLGTVLDALSAKLSDPLGPLEVREHQDVEQLGAATGWTARARGDGPWGRP